MSASKRQAATAKPPTGHQPSSSVKNNLSCLTHTESSRTTSSHDVSVRERVANFEKGTRNSAQSHQSIERPVVPVMERPIPLFECDDSGKFTLNEDAKMFLEEATCKVSVISVAGRYRTGKSYILNRMFKKNKGFGLGSTVESKTKGIWMWARPHPKDPTCLLILLDTEGLHDVKKGDEQHDAKLFTLAILLSKCLVYNAVGSMDERLIKEFELVTSLTNHIRVEENSEEEYGDHFDRYFPTLFIVLRDFFLDLKIDEKYCTANEYMENALTLKLGKGDAINTYNNPRKCIRKYFRNRHCFTLCKPVDDDKQLKVIDDLKDFQIKSQFLTEVTKCVEDILIAGKNPLELDGHVVNGQRFIQMAKFYMDAVNDESKVPCIASTAQYLRITECEKAITYATACFDEEMSTLLPVLPVDIHELEEAQKRAYTKSLTAFKQRALQDEKGEYGEKFMAEVRKQYEAMQNKNRETSIERCESLLVEYFNDLSENIAAQKYLKPGGYKEYCKEKEDAIKAYQSAPHKGPESQKVLNNYKENQAAVERTLINADEALSDNLKKKKIIEEEMKREKDRAAEAEKEHERARAEMKRQADESERMMADVKREALLQQEKNRKEMKAEWEAKTKELERLHKEGMDKEAEEFDKILKRIQREKETTEQEQNKRMRELEEKASKLAEELREKTLAMEQFYKNFMPDSPESRRGAGFIERAGDVISWIGRKTNT